MTGRSYRFRPVRSGIAMAVMVVAAVASRTAPCQEPSVDDRTMAEALFRSGRELMAEGRYSDACRKLEQSQRLVRAAGTLINLAVCHEKEGKIATAWVEYQESLSISIRMNRPDREQVARERMEAIEPLVPHLRIDVPDEARVEGLVITRGETDIPDVSWAVRLPMDPGTYELRAAAPGRVPWSTQVKLQQGRDEVVTVPRLSPTRAPEPAKPLPVAPQPVAVNQPVRSAPTVERVEEGSRAGWRTAGWAGCGVGVALAAVGGYYGVRALQRRSESDSYCTDRGCYVEGVELNDEARDMAVRSNVFLAAGAVLAGAGTVVLLALPSHREGRTEEASRVSLSAAPGGVSAAVHLAW
jgi:Tfp pilus assembly protein PilF